MFIAIIRFSYIFVFVGVLVSIFIRYKNVYVSRNKKVYYSFIIFSVSICIGFMYGTAFLLSDIVFDTLRNIDQSSILPISILIIVMIGNTISMLYLSSLSLEIGEDRFVYRNLVHRKIIKFEDIDIKASSYIFIESKMKHNVNLNEYLLIRLKNQKEIKLRTNSFIHTGNAILLLNTVANKLKIDREIKIK